MAETAERYVRSSGFVSRRVAGETVLVPVGARSRDPRARAASLYVLNETGEHLWGHLTEARGLEELARNLIVRYEVEPDRARADAEAFVGELVALGAVTRVSAGERTT